jgi:cell division initiation protein
MRLTPLDIHHKEFRNSLRGYNAEEVDQFLDEVADEFERLFKENIDLSEKADAAEGKVREYAEIEHAIQNTLLAAQRSADDTLSRAQKDADQLVRDAEVKAKDLVQDALAEKQQWQADIARVRDAEEEFRSRFRDLLKNYLREIGESAENDPDDVTAQAVAEMKAVTAPEPKPAPKPIAPFKADLEAARQAEPEPAPPSGSTEPMILEEKTAGGSVHSLSLGEIGETDLLDEEIPPLDAPDEFEVPKRATFGERDDDLDIEEID